MQNHKIKQKQNKKAGRGHPLPFFTHMHTQNTGPNNLLQIYNNAKNIKNRRKI